jgi:hypothetical protein
LWKPPRSRTQNNSESRLIGVWAAIGGGTSAPSLVLPTAVLSMIEYTSMSTNVSDELLQNFRKSDDPVIEARRQRILHALLEDSPQVRQALMSTGIEKGIEKGLIAARSMLRGVLDRRNLPLTPDQEARIEKCADFDTLRRWVEQAVTAATAAAALQ